MSTTQSLERQLQDEVVQQVIAATEAYVEFDKGDGWIQPDFLHVDVNPELTIEVHEESFVPLRVAGTIPDGNVTGARSKLPGQIDFVAVLSVIDEIDDGMMLLTYKVKES